MPKRFPRIASSRLGAQIQSKVAQAASALGEILEIMREQEGKVRKARGSSRQDYLRDALRAVQQFPTQRPMEDADLGILSAEGLEQELRSLAAETHVGMQQVLAQSEGNLEEIKDKMARLEAVYVTLGRGIQILQAPKQAGPAPVEKLQFDLNEKIASLGDKIGSMLQTLEDTRDAEHLRISSLRPQVEKALGLLHRAGVVPRKGARVWWQNNRSVPARNRLPGAIK